MSMSYDEIGEALRTAREKAGLSQSDVARKIGLKSGWAIGKIESAESHSSIERLSDFAEAVGLKLEVHVVDPADARAELWHRLQQFVAEADPVVLGGISSMVEVWERQQQRAEDAELPARDIG